MMSLSREAKEASACLVGGDEAALLMSHDLVRLFLLNHHVPKEGALLLLQQPPVEWKTRRWPRLAQTLPFIASPRRALAVVLLTTLRRRGCIAISSHTTRQIFFPQSSSMRTILHLALRHERSQSACFAGTPSCVASFPGS